MEDLIALFWLFVQKFVRNFRKAFSMNVDTGNEMDHFKGNKKNFLRKIVEYDGAQTNKFHPSNTAIPSISCFLFHKYLRRQKFVYLGQKKGEKIVRDPSYYFSIWVTFGSRISYTLKKSKKIECFQQISHI